MDRLNPCRICGGEAMLVSAPCKRGISPYIWCVRCRSGCFSTPIYISDHDAVEAWNNINITKRERSKE